jgi:hypothetical protein
MKLAHVALLALPIVFAAACVADVGDAPDEPSLEDQGMRLGSAGPAAAALRAWIADHPGTCGQGCLGALARTCDRPDGITLAQACGDHDDPFLHCGGTWISCAAAQAATSWPSGVDECFAICRLDQ